MQRVVLIPYPPHFPIQIITQIVLILTSEYKFIQIVPFALENGLTFFLKYYSSLQTGFHTSIFFPLKSVFHFATRILHLLDSAV